MTKGFLGYIYIYSASIWVTKREYSDNITPQALGQDLFDNFKQIYWFLSGREVRIRTCLVI